MTCSDFFFEVNAVNPISATSACDPTASDYLPLDMWPPGPIQDWLEPDDAAVLQHKLQVLGRSGVVSILGVLAQRGPQALAQVVELAQLRPSIAHERLTQLHAIGILTHHRRRTDQQPVMWELNHDAMVRLGAYFIRPRLRLSSTAPAVVDRAGEQLTNSDYVSEMR